MRKLYLNITIKTRRGPLGTFVATEKQDWERLPNGDVLLRIEGEPDEFLVGATSVSYEQRARSTKKS